MLRILRGASRPVLTLTACLSVSIGIALVPVPAAQAAMVVTTAINQAVIGFSDDGPATCTVTETGDSTNQAYGVNTGTNTQSVSNTSTITDNGDATDVTNLSASAVSRARATRTGGTVRIDWSGTLKEAMQTSQGPATDCDASATAAAANVLQFAIDENTWTTLDAPDLAPGLVAQVFIIKTSPPTPPVQQVYVLAGGHAHAHFDVLLLPGNYIMQMIVQHELQVPSVQVTSVTHTFRIDTTFVPAGTATGKTSGPAGKYVKFANERVCGTDSLKAKWKAAAGQGQNGKVDKATFFVNGDKVKTVNHPHKGQTTTLNNLADDQAAAVKVRLKLAAGGALVATRSYLSCS